MNLFKVNSMQQLSFSPGALGFTKERISIKLIFSK